MTTRPNHIKPALLTAVSVERTVQQLNRIHAELLIAYANLPKPSFAKEHLDTEQLLTHLAMSWKDVGNALFRGQKNAAAMEAYQNALKIYNLNGFSGKDLALSTAKCNSGYKMNMN